MTPSSSLIKEISVNSRPIRLLIRDDVPTVEFGNQTYIHLWLLVQQLPQLSDPANIHHFAEISNFLWKGTAFHCIASIEHFQMHYAEQINLEKKCPGDIFPYRLTDYKIFDVSVMHPPLIHEGNLIYFVYNTENGLPYRVVCPFPYLSNSTLVHYQILPIIEEEQTL